MKKIVSILSLLVIAASLFFGCKVEDSSVRGINERGMAVTSYWQMVTQTVLLQNPNTAFTFNAWLSASEEEHPAIEDKYFINKKLRQISDNEWAVIANGVTVCRIQTGGKLLSDPGAAWTLTSYEKSNSNWYNIVPFGEDSVLTEVTSQGNLTWDIRVHGTASPSDYTPYAHFIMTSMLNDVPETLSDSYCSISGDGCYAARTHQFQETGNGEREIYTYIRFTLSDATTDNVYYWIGTLNMRVYADGELGAGHYNEVLIHDDLSVRQSHQYADITMQDVTETWEVIPFQSLDDHFQCFVFFPVIF